MAKTEFVDVAYKTGAGRYLQQADALELAGGEVARLGSRAFVVGGPNGLRVAGARLGASLEAAGVPFDVRECDCPTSYEPPSAWLVRRARPAATWWSALAAGA